MTDKLDSAKAPSKGAWTVGETLSTHNHPTRYWETSVHDERKKLVATANGETQDESERLGLLISKGPDLADYVRRQAEKGDDEAKALYEALSR